MKKYAIFVPFLILFACTLFSQSTGPNAGTNRYNSGYTAVTKTATSLTIYTTNVINIHCANTSGSDATLTITNTAGNTYFPGVTITAGAVMVAHYGQTGLTFYGIKLSSSSDTAISCQVTGLQ